MKFIKLEQPSLDKTWALQFMDDEHFDTCFDEDVFVTKPNGEPLLVLIKGGITERSATIGWSVLKDLKLITRNRGNAAGRKNEEILHKDGTRGKYLNSAKGWEVYSGIVGYFERTVRLPYCRACAWNLEHPEKFAALMPMVKETNDLFAKHVPERYAKQQAFAERTAKDFLIPETVFTTLTINKNFRTACHLDAGDLEEGFSCMSVLRRGKFNGAKLVLPNWKIAVDLQDRDVVLFDAHEWHGNTQFVPISSDAQRCSIVHYYRENMVKCKAFQQELALVKNRKAGTPLWGD